MRRTYDAAETGSARFAAGLSAHAAAVSCSTKSPRVQSRSADITRRRRCVSTVSHIPTVRFSLIAC